MSTQNQSGWPRQWFRGHPVPTGAGGMLPMPSIGVSLNRLMAQHDGLVQAVVRWTIGLSPRRFKQVASVSGEPFLRLCPGQAWASTSRGVWHSPPTPGPLLCARRLATWFSACRDGCEGSS